MKVDSKEMLMSLFWGEEFESSSRNEDCMYKDMEDFLFKMLGEEFRLERDAIQEVLNRCGYNMQKVVDAFVKGDQDQANKILEQEH
ncbi:putative nuclear RNA export factor SDE5 [Gossypium arboreum]|uniref:putative nuclear RNA export factor SDE5 n=1 Tax=Gossypium arboreum TaxID=29729 RepID=UPI0008196952|nr:putative nuclear RNA export factor SDE5 [Gossypium arboreum]XP_052887358.1 putative nuclear RNA export factor SDE5 [Gossypium arboreum]